MYPIMMFLLLNMFVDHVHKEKRKFNDTNINKWYKM